MADHNFWDILLGFGLGIFFVCFLALCGGWIEDRINNLRLWWICRHVHIRDGGGNPR